MVIRIKTQFLYYSQKIHIFTGAPTPYKLLNMRCKIKSKSKLLIQDSNQLNWKSDCKVRIEIGVRIIIRV